MKLVGFSAKCPFEIGDKVRINIDEYRTITDISCTHYVNSGKTEFRYELNESGKYLRLELAQVKDIVYRGL